ncbi:MAG: imidazole glycerol phosphate synthase cyclase subunit [Candidatus Omnitrophota bacterium]
MIKTRIIPTLLYRDTVLVKGVSFDSWRCVGYVLQSVKVYCVREVDELIFLDITASQQNRMPDFHLIDDIADECFMPLTVGGGIRSVEDVRRLLACGADKVAINTAAFLTPDLIKESAREFGSQCIIVSVDVKKTSKGTYETAVLSGNKTTGLDPVEFSKKMQDLGAGEILLTSVDRDGTMLGYDVELTRKVSDAVSIPVIASGGAGSPEHVFDVLKEGKASAAAAASMYHFTQTTPLEVKKYLTDHEIKVRI